MKNTKITTGIILIFLLINTTNTSGASVPWQEGDLYSFTQTNEIESNSKQINGDLITNFIVNQEIPIEFTIDNIDETDQLIDLEYARTSGNLYLEEGKSFNATYYGDNLVKFIVLETDGHYSFFSIYLNYQYFINPENFDKLNDQAKSNFEDLLDQEINNSTTFEDFFDEADSLDFMGAKTAADAADEFTDDRFEWTFELDLTNVLEYSVENDDGDIKWLNYDKYIVKTTVKYDKDGVLQEYSNFVEYNVITDELEIYSRLEEKIFSGTGAIASLTAPGFELYSVLSLFIAIPVLRRFRKEETL